MLKLSALALAVLASGVLATPVIEKRAGELTDPVILNVSSRLDYQNLI